MESRQQEGQKTSLLSPEALVKIKDLFLVARGVVEGFVAGHHKSPYKGFSLEFAEHRKYVPGDELKHMDWKVYARTEKFFIKQFEAETNMRVFLMVDVSNSMSFSGSEKGVSKLQYAKYLAASLAYLISRQQDLVGLVTYTDKIEVMIPPRNGPGHLRKLMNSLTDLEAEGKTKTNIVLKDLAERVGRRSLLIVLSDLLDEQNSVIDAVRRFRHRRHEVILMHLLDNFEWAFPYQEMTTFRDLESDQKMTVDPLALREEYLRGINDFKHFYQIQAAKMKVDYQPVNTIMPFEYVLSSYLAARRKFA